MINNLLLNATYTIAIAAFVVAKIIETMQDNRPLPIYWHLIVTVVIALAMTLQILQHSWGQTIALAVFMSASMLSVYLSYARPRLEEKLAIATAAVAGLLMKNHLPLNKETN